MNLPAPSSDPQQLVRPPAARPTPGAAPDQSGASSSAPVAQRPRPPNPASVYQQDDRARPPLTGTLTAAGLAEETKPNTPVDPDTVQQLVKARQAKGALLCCNKVKGFPCSGPMNHAGIREGGREGGREGEVGGT